MTSATPAPAAFPAHLCQGIASDAVRQLDAMAARGIHAISFAPSGGWVIVGRPGEAHVGYAARGIPDPCFVKLGEFVRAGHAIRCIAFPPGGGWLIVSDQAYFASGIPDGCFGALIDAWAEGLRPSCVAFAPGGGWALLPVRTRLARGCQSPACSNCRTGSSGGAPRCSSRSPPRRLGAGLGRPRRARRHS